MGDSLDVRIVTSVLLATLYSALGDRRWLAKTHSFALKSSPRSPLTRRPTLKHSSEVFQCFYAMQELPIASSFRPPRLEREVDGPLVAKPADVLPSDDLVPLPLSLPIPCR